MRFIRQPKSWTWVAEEEGHTVGFAIASEEPQRVGHVITLDVDQARRRSGIGTALMDAAEAWARRKCLQLMYLETGEENRAAQHFYLGRGYVKVDELTDYYAGGKSAWLMIKWFK
jgi:ribosomal protein S18 acetylase RimI-like enzyme